MKILVCSTMAKSPWCMVHLEEAYTFWFGLHAPVNYGEQIDQKIRNPNVDKNQKKQLLLWNKLKFLRSFHICMTLPVVWASNMYHMHEKGLWKLYVYKFYIHMISMTKVHSMITIGDSLLVRMSYLVSLFLSNLRFKL